MLTTDPARTADRVARQVADFDQNLSREWLLTNGRGGFASGTLLGIPTRRYHGLLVAAARPPLERWMLLSATLERVESMGQTAETPGFCFGDVCHPHGFEHQVDFAVSNHGPTGIARFVYAWGDVCLTKSVQMARGADEVTISYRLESPRPMPVSLAVSPFAAMRDFHGLTRAFEGGFPFAQMDGQVVLGGRDGSPRLWLKAEAVEGARDVTFEPHPDWWYGFYYREEAHRGQDCREDLFSPGWFKASGTGAIAVVLRAAADFRGEDRPASERFTMVVPDKAMPAEPSVEERLIEAADAFVVRRQRADGGQSTTILAGYPWFGDWGRDTFIALPGLLLETGRFDEAREVLATFASAQKDGLIPNRFSDYGDGCDYNSVDASLWYVHGADAYCRAGGDANAWNELLGPVCARVVEAFRRGTHFNIHMDADGLMICGDASTQLTWMDAKWGDTVFTPRHGKPVEINALWYHALRIMASRSAETDPSASRRYAELADRVQQAFAKVFWNGSRVCLFDVVRGDDRDGAVRPNQVFAVSLPHSPLNRDQQRAVVDCVERELLTPFGLRSLSPRDSAYRPRYCGNSYERDSAYHQGTVWGWLIGPYVEAYLRTRDFSPKSRAETRERLMPLVEHLDEAGLGQVSEVFDGDPPHRPGGCFAQAWSVAELLRAWHLTDPQRGHGGSDDRAD